MDASDRQTVMHGGDGELTELDFHRDDEDDDLATLFEDVLAPVVDGDEPDGARHNPFLRVAYGRKLLDYDQERELGRRLCDARAAMAQGLAPFPACVARLLEAWGEALGGERSPGDVLQWPSGTPESGGEGAADADSSRRRMAALELRHACWVAETRDVERHEVPLDIQQMFIDVAPAFCMLSELRTVARESTHTTPDVAAALCERLAQVDAAELRFQEARRIMLECNLRLVFSIAGRFVNNGIAYDDLVQEGTIGLLRAIEKFDPLLGFKFSTYASTWIWQAVTRAIANQRRTVRVPAHIHDKMLRVRTIAAQIEQERGTSPSIDELAKASGLTPDVVTRALNAASRAMSLDAPVRAGEDTTFVELTADEERPDPADAVHDQRLAALVRDLLEELPSREATILSMRMGLDGREPQTLEDIGTLLGITRERTRQLQNRALDTLRKRLQARDVGPIF